MRQLKITKQVTNRETASLDKYLQEIGKVDLITADEEVILAQKIRAGDTIALNKLIKATYELLGLATYFTAGADECRAWTFKKGMKAPECAGIIHTDFQKGFIKAEVMSYDDLISAGSEAKVKENGKLRIEGKEYVMQDGDICHFRFNL